MSELNLDNIVGFKAVDKDGNEQNVTVDEMVDMVATRMVSALSETSSLSEISTLATAAATGNDVYENELPIVTDAANVRVLQSSGDAAQMTMQSLATKLGGLFTSLQLYPFMIKTTIKYENFNSTEKSGFYHVSGTTENRPSNVDSKLLDWGILVVYEVYSTQIFIPTNYSSFVFIRTKTPAGFNKWARFEGSLLTI